MRELSSLARPLVIAAAIVFSGVSVQGADVPGLTTIRIVDAGQDVDAEAFYAQELGIFKKYGINADITGACARAAERPPSRRSPAARRTSA